MTLSNPTTLVNLLFQMKQTKPWWGFSGNAVWMMSGQCGLPSLFGSWACRDPFQNLKRMTHRDTCQSMLNVEIHANVSTSAETRKKKKKSLQI
jgi:hypothetical protein